LDLTKKERTINFVFYLTKVINKNNVKKCHKMDLREIASAYQSIYLKEEVEEENILLEDLSQDEVDDLVEEIIDEFLEEGFSIEQIEEGFEDYISSESEVLNEARRAKRRTGGKSYDEVKAEIDAKEKASAEKRAAKKAKVAADKAAAVVRPSEKLANAARKALPAAKERKALPAAKERKALPPAKKEKAKGTGGLLGSRSVPTRKDLGAAPEPEFGPGAKKKNPGLPKMPKKSPAKVETGPKAKVKAGVRKAMLYRGIGDGKKFEVAGKGSGTKTRVRKMSDVVASAERKAASPKEKVKRAAKETVKKARNFVGTALGKLADKVKSESNELDSFDTVVAYLIDEEIASDFTEAIEKMTKLSEETIAKIHASQLQLLDEAVYGGEKKEEKKDTRMTVTNADKKANTPAYQNYMKGDKRYKAADHMKEENN
tara:strand:- start:1104 stop:2393 length:1290 start_codon:yes stop_codon:yes gene_type:complete